MMNWRSASEIRTLFLLGKIEGIHVEDDRDILRKWSFFENLLDVMGEGPRVVRTERDLEAELTVGADER